jgi:hypothetical protein
MRGAKEERGCASIGIRPPYAAGVRLKIRRHGGRTGPHSGAGAAKKRRKWSGGDPYDTLRVVHRAGRCPRLESSSQMHGHYGTQSAAGAMPGLKLLTISPGQAPDDPKMTAGNHFLIRGGALWCNARSELPNHLGLPTPRTTRK